MPVAKGVAVWLVAASAGWAVAAPSVPRGLAMVAQTTNSITLAWYRSSNEVATAYHLFASATTNGDFTRVATVSERMVTHSNLTAATTNFYKVSAANADGESARSQHALGFTTTPCAGAPFPVRVAKNMCVSLGAAIVSRQVPLTGKLSNLVDGSDATGCRLRRACELKIRLNADRSLADADYLLLHFRTDCGPVDWSNDRFARTLKNYVVIESKDSTNGEDGTWQEVVSGTNALLDAVIVLPNHQPKWIGVRSSYGPSDQVPAANDRRLMPSDLILCRLDVFRSAPTGQRNDYWIFVGDSLVVQDLPGGADAGRSAWFSDLMRQQHPDRYPMVVHLGRGGQMLKDTLPYTRSHLPVLSPANGTPTPTGTIICWETGFNDVGVGGSLGLGAHLIKSYAAAQDLCRSNGLFMVPVRIEYSTGYLDLTTLEPVKDNIFFNTLAVNLGGVDSFCRTHTPYACDPATQRPYADYWTYTRKNYATALSKDGVHHTKAGSDGINQLWAEVADKMIYSRQR
jgi:chitodextrinase